MRHGFSLVELSIVLVILGLLTGGILAGQSLIRAAELRSVTTEFQRWQTAINTFKSKYISLPGDMRNATSFWGSAGGSGTIGDGCESLSGTGTQTCNGDGNGAIYSNTSGTSYNEYFTAWQQLANAGLIEGNYTGRNGGGSNPYDANIGINVPSSRISNAGWFLGNPMNVSGGSNSNYFDRSYAHRFMIGSDITNNSTDGPVITPSEAWNIHSKIDDGMPAIGNIVSYKNSSPKTPNCTNSDTSSAQYNLTFAGKLCSLLFILSW